jgi:hypothetical protein
MRWFYVPPKYSAPLTRGFFTDADEIIIITSVPRAGRD